MNTLRYKTLITSSFLLCIISFTSVAQERSVFYDSIQNLVNDTEKYITWHSKSPDSGFLMIRNAEELAKKSNNLIDKISVLRGKAFLYHSNRDTVTSSKYVAQIKNLLKQCSDSLEVARCYEVFGVLEKSSKKTEKYYLKAHRLFSVYGKPEHLIDINFNLAFYYHKIKNWESGLKYSQQGIQAINQSGKKTERKKYLYTFILQSYVEQKKFNKAKEIVGIIDTIRSKADYNRYSLFEYMYLKRTAKLYTNIHQEQKALQLYTAAFAVIDSLRKQEAKRVSDGLLFQNELNIQNEKLKRFEIENKLKKSQIKVGLIIIAFITALLIFLLFFSFYHKRNAKKISAMNEALEKQNKDLEAMTSKLETALKAKTEFLNVMTHELFTPINGIAIIAHNLKTETDKQCFNQNLELLEFSSNYLYRLLKNIVDTKSIDKKNITLNVDVVHLKSLIKTITKTAAVFLKTSTNTFQYHIDSNIPDPLFVDSVKLSQILINLLNNANKFTTKGNIILNVALEIETDTNAKVIFKIIDTGIGVEPDLFDHIFEKFQYGSTEIKEKYGGSGIGLYIVKHFLLLHNSKIHISSDKGKGTAFSFSIWFDKVHKSMAKI